MEKEEFKHNILSCEQWGRFIYMVLFSVVLYLIIPVVAVVVIVQLLLVFVTGSTNDNIRQFSTDLARYISQIILFLTYNENTKPFPFMPWKSESDTDQTPGTDSNS